MNSIDRALKIRDYCNKLKLGYDRAPDCNFYVGPEPFKLNDDELTVFVNQGEQFRTWFEITLELCTRAYRNPNFKWLADLIEGESPDQVKQIHREVHLSGLLNIPLFARPDMSAIGATVEVQTPGSGWGYQTAIHNIVSESKWPGPVNGIKKAVATLTGSSSAPSAYVLYNDPFFPEVEYFCRLCKEAGMQLQMYFQALPQASEVKFVRRPPLEDLLSYKGGSELVQSWLDGRLVLEPGPSLLFDQKMAILFPFHPLLREFYSDSIRKLFPENYLVARDSQLVFDGNLLSWDELCNLSKSKRQFILKYAGAKKGLRAGGKAVYNLSDCNHKKVQELLAMAMQDWEKHRSPWLIQKRVQQKYPIVFLDHITEEIKEAQYYALFRPMYSFLPDEPTQIVALTALFRKEWKVHGSSDTVTLPVEA